MRSSIRTLIVLLVISSSSIATISSQKTDTLTFLEKQLLNCYKKILEAPSHERLEPAEAFYCNFVSCLKVEGSFEFPFKILENIGKIYSPDKRLRIYTWNVPVRINENLYYGIIQFYSPHHKEYFIYTLNYLHRLADSTQIINWEGSLYYSTVETKHASQKYYTLLGYNLSTPLSNKKVIEVISIDDFDKLYFCKKLIKYDGHLVDRVVFEYNEKAIMSLQYNDSMKMIVFDHLSPSKPSLMGQYEFYGPDFTYDGLKWEKGIWVHYSNIDVTN